MKRKMTRLVDECQPRLTETYLMDVIASEILVRLQKESMRNIVRATQYYQVFCDLNR